MENFQDRGVWIRSISDRIRNPVVDYHFFDVAPKCARKFVRYEKKGFLRIR